MAVLSAEDSVDPGIEVRTANHYIRARMDVWKPARPFQEGRRRQEIVAALGHCFVSVLSGLREGMVLYRLASSTTTKCACAVDFDIEVFSSHP